MGCSYGKAPERVRRTPSQRPGPLGVGWSHMAMILALLPCAFGLRVTAVSRWGPPSMQILSASPASAQHVLHRGTKHLVTRESVIRAPFDRASPPSRTSGSTALNPDNARSPDQVLDGRRKIQAPGPEPARGSAAGAPGHRPSIRVGNLVVRIATESTSGLWPAAPTRPGSSSATGNTTPTGRIRIRRGSTTTTSRKARNTRARTGGQTGNNVSH